MSFSSSVTQAKAAAAVAAVLTIAGSDSSGGAGIQADLKSMNAFGVHGASVLTAVTAQNSLGVQAIHEIPIEIVVQQIRSVLDDIGQRVFAIKTGMLHSAELIDAIRKELLIYRDAKGLKFQLIVDPVMVASTGAALLREDAVAALVTLLRDLAFIVTPNIPETLALLKHLGSSTTGIETEADMKQAAAELADQLHVPYVLIKGGHLELNPDGTKFDGKDVPFCFDVLLEKQTKAFTVFKSQRLNSSNTHGTGCTLSASIAARIALIRNSNDIGMEHVVQAVDTAREYVRGAIANGFNLGRGSYGLLDHAWMSRSGK